MNNLLENLKLLRKEKNLSQRDVAKALDIHFVNYNRYENGSHQIPLEILIKLADFYDISLDELVGRNEKYYR